MADSSDKGLSSDAMIWVVLLGIILLFSGVILYAQHVTLVKQQDQAKAPVVAKYTNYAYGINLRFPPDWKAAGGQVYDRYEGDDGFFSVGAAGTDDSTIDEVARDEAKHVLKPYGADPAIQRLTIDGRDARLIMPSPDQDKAMANQAALIAEYPVPKVIGSVAYRFLVLWADKAHIQEISSTITFVR